MANRFQNALDIQTACNPSGIAHSLIAACAEVREEGGGTDAIKSDPAVRLMVYQLAYLCNAGEFDSSLHAYGEASDACLLASLAPAKES